MQSPHHRTSSRGSSSGSSPKENAAQPPQDNPETSLYQEQHVADISHGLSELEFGDSPVCRKRNVRCSHFLPPLKPERESDTESATTLTATEPRVQHTTPRLIRQPQVHRITKAQHEGSETSSILNRTHRNPFGSDGSSVSSEEFAAELNHAIAYVPKNVPYALRRYLNENEKDSPLSERLLRIANSPDKKPAWSVLASVRERRVVWTRSKKSAMGDSGIIMGSEMCGNDNEAKNVKVSVMGDSGIDIRSEICGNDNEARNTKLNAYIPPDEDNKNLTVFVGGPRKKLKYENNPFDCRTGNECTQPPRLKQKKDSRDPPQTGFSGKATQNITCPAPSQMFSSPMTQSATMTSQELTVQGHSQIFSTPTSQFYNMAIQDDGLPPLQLHQMLNLPENGSFYQSYTDPSPPALQGPYSTTLHSPGLDGQGGWAPPPPSSQVFNQQADPIRQPTNIPFRGETAALLLPSTEWLQQHNALPEDDLQDFSTVRNLTPQQPFAIQSSPGYLEDLGSAFFQQGSLSNQGMPFPVPIAHPTGGFSYDKQHRDSMLSAAQDNTTFLQTASQEDFHFSISEIQENVALRQPRDQEDQNFSTPSLSFGRPSTETASTPFDISSNQTDLDLGMCEPLVLSGPPLLSFPPNTLDGVAANFALEATEEDSLAKWSVDGIARKNDSIPTLE